jgi:hypothetical protein
LSSSLEKERLSLEKNVIEFNHTFIVSELENVMRNSEHANYYLYRLLTLSCQVQNKVFFTYVLDMAPNSLFLSDLVFRFFENVTKFFSYYKNQPDVLMSYMDFMIQISKKMCSLRDYFHEDFYISQTFQYDLCFRLHENMMIREHLKKMFFQYSENIFPYVFMRHVADYQLYFRNIRSIINLYPKYFMELEPFEKFFLQIF